jgi:hypothetical protein
MSAEALSCILYLGILYLISSMIGISQAQVSRVEKAALEKLRKQL